MVTRLVAIYLSSSVGATASGRRTKLWFPTRRWCLLLLIIEVSGGHWRVLVTRPMRGLLILRYSLIKIVMELNSLLLLFMTAFILVTWHFFTNSLMFRLKGVSMVLKWLIVGLIWTTGRAISRVLIDHCQVCIVLEGTRERIICDFCSLKAFFSLIHDSR